MPRFATHILEIVFSLRFLFSIAIAKANPITYITLPQPRHVYIRSRSRNQSLTITLVFESCRTPIQSICPASKSQRRSPERDQRSTSTLSHNPFARGYRVLTFDLQDQYVQPATKLPFDTHPECELTNSSRNHSHLQKRQISREGLLRAH